MTTSRLYEEALADARRLREIAEQNAKNAIIQSITPKIREMIDAQVLGESDDFDEGDVLEEALEDTAEGEYTLTPDAAKELKDLFETTQETAIVSSDTIELNALRSEKVIESIKSDGSTQEEIDSAICIFENFVQNLSDSDDENAQKISANLNAIKEAREDFEKLNKLHEDLAVVTEITGRINDIDASSIRGKDLKNYIALVAISDRALNKLKEAVEAASYSQLLENTVNNSKDQIQTIEKEIKEMKRSLRDLLSEEVITIELDLGEDAEVNSEEISVKVVEEDEIIDADADEEDEEVEVEDVAVEDVEVEEEEVDLSEILNELEEGEGHMEEGGMYYEDEDMDEGMYTEEDDDAHEGHGHKMMEGLDDDTVLEIDENMLREELAKLMQESEFDAEEEVLEETAEPVATEQNDELQAEIESYQSAVADLQSQLAEMSLFNAKLLYTNKLLMNSDLSQTQRAQAIETLDDAASLREVKLLFKTLTESFSKRAEDKTSSRNIGGASRPTKSASMNLNESTEANRWALLAGIK